MKKTRIKYFVMIFAIFVSVFSVLLSSNTASAADTQASCTAAGGAWKYVNSGPGGQNEVGTCTMPKVASLSPLDQLKSYAYYTALSSCARNGLVDGAFLSNQWNIRISSADASTTSNWLKSDESISTGYLISSSGTQKCSDMIAPALALWGYSASRYEAFLGQVGYIVTSDYICVNDSDYAAHQTCTGDPNLKAWTADITGSTILDKFRQTIKLNVYGNKDPTLDGNNGLLYLRAQSNIELASTCGATAFKKVSDLTAEEKVLYPNNNDGLAVTSTGTGTYGTSTSSPDKDYLIVHLVNGTTWQKEDWVYKISKTSWSKAFTLGEKSSGGSDQATCVGLAMAMNGYADGIVKDAKAIRDAGGDPSAKYGAYINTPNGAGAAITSTASTGNTASSPASSCVIEGVGWIICPVFNFLGGVTDAIYGVIAGMLATDVSIVATDTGTYSAWSTMRTLANAGFVIVFLIIIFSQLTGAGVSNYGVKKLLPRIIVAAILVNLSFFISQLAVDLSNILGGSLKGLIEGMVPKTAGTNVLATGNGFTNVVVGVFSGQMAIGAVATAGVVAYYGSAGLLIPIILAAILAVIVTLFILIARQALIILLIVVSPIAFLAMLLPNTETYFKQWRKMFVALLLVYPMVAVLFGASYLASAILLTSFGGSGNILGLLVALAVMVLPLFAVPVLLKGSLNAIPAVGKFANKWASKANGLVGKQAKQGYQRSNFGQASALRRRAKEQYRAKKFTEGASSGVGALLAGGVGVTGAQRFAKKTVARAMTSASDKATDEEINEAQSLMLNTYTDPATKIDEVQKELEDAFDKNDVVRARAAQKILLASGGKGLTAIESAISAKVKTSGVKGSLEDKGSDVATALRRDIANAGLKPKNNALVAWATGNNETIATLQDAKNDAGTFSSLSDLELAGHNLGNLTAAATSGVIDGARAEQMLSNPTVYAALGGNERTYIASLAAPVVAAREAAAAAATQTQAPAVTVDIHGSASDHQAVIDAAGGVQNLSASDLKVIHESAEKYSVRDDAKGGTAMTDVGLSALEELDRRGRS